MLLHRAAFHGHESLDSGRRGVASVTFGIFLGWEIGSELEFF